MCWALKHQKECNMNIVIISGGTLEKEFASDLVKKRESIVLIGVDGGLQFCYDHRLIPDYIVGDFDTIDASVLEIFKGEKGVVVKQYNPCKDVTDTQAAVSLAIECIKEAGSLSSSCIYLLGGLGSRLDHTLANIGCLKEALASRVQMKIVNGNNCMYLYNQDFVIERKNLCYQEYLSLIALENVTGLAIKGMKYEVEDLELSILSGRGVSNELSGEVAEITFSSGTLLVIESRDKREE